MRTKKFFLSLAIIGTAVGLGLSLSACKRKAGEEVKSNQAQTAEPERIKVQHVLIAFEGTLPGQPVERTKEQAEKLAQEVLEKAKGGKADFDALVKEFSSDRPPGIYDMVNFNIPPEANAFPRDQMVPAFGDIGFHLAVGEVGLAPYDAQKSPFGYHIIKRLN